MQILAKMLLLIIAIFAGVGIIVFSFIFLDFILTILMHGYA